MPFNYWGLGFVTGHFFQPNSNDRPSRSSLLSPITTLTLGQNNSTKMQWENYEIETHDSDIFITHMGVVFEFYY